VLETANPPGSYPSGILIEPVHGRLYVLIVGYGVDGLACSGSSLKFLWKVLRKPLV